MNFFKFSAILLLSTFLFSFSFLYAQDESHRSLLLTNTFVSDKVKHMITDTEKLGSKKSILSIQSNLSDLQKLLGERYKGELVLVDNPFTDQEQLSQAIDSLSRYLCIQREKVLTNYTDSDYYQFDNGSDQLEYQQGVCYRNGMLLHQEGIHYYTLPDIGTLQTAPLLLLNDLGYSTQNLEDYIKSDDLQIDSSDMFFLEANANDEIVPLFNLTNSDIVKKRKKQFDAIKVIAYVESSDYPFVNGNIMIAIFALQGDTIIKITTPYGKIQYPLLENMMQILHKMFVYSIQENLSDSILLSNNYERVYDILVRENNFPQNEITKNLVHYYLTTLWQYDDQPKEFTAALSTLVDKDLTFQIKLQSELETLAPFFK